MPDKSKLPTAFNAFNKFKKNFGYKIIESLPLKEGIAHVLSLPKRKPYSFSRKHIMAELASINPECVCCGIVATKFCLGISNDGGGHWDLYTEDDIALSLDHIKPKSKGGRNCLENSQIMCTTCNSLKSNKPERIIAYKILLDAGVEDITITVRNNPFLRVGYWKRLSNEVLCLIDEYFTEEAIWDEDCGWLYTYYFKDKEKCTTDTIMM